MWSMFRQDLSRPIHPLISQPCIKRTSTFFGCRDRYLHRFAASFQCADWGIRARKSSLKIQESYKYHKNPFSHRQQRKDLHRLVHFFTKQRPSHKTPYPSFKPARVRPQRRHLPSTPSIKPQIVPYQILPPRTTSISAASISSGTSPANAKCSTPPPPNSVLLSKPRIQNTQRSF